VGGREGAREERRKRERERERERESLQAQRIIGLLHHFFPG
jgi:hypothetical protein